MPRTRASGPWWSGSGAAKPSDESREAVVWQEQGLLTLTGGKLTTFRLTAHEALRKLRQRLPGLKLSDDGKPLLEPVPALSVPGLSGAQAERLMGRYGRHAAELVAPAQPGELEPFPETPVSPAELRWSARARAWCTWMTSLLRRSRLGMTYVRGAQGLLPDIRRNCQPELGWSDSTWEREEAAYRLLWESCYSLPLGLVPRLRSAGTRRRTSRRWRTRRRRFTASGLHHSQADQRLSVLLGGEPVGFGQLLHSSQGRLLTRSQKHPGISQQLLGRKGRPQIKPVYYSNSAHPRESGGPDLNLSAMPWSSRFPLSRE